MALRADLVLVADRPSLGAERVLWAVAAALAAAPGRILVIDREGGGEAADARSRLSHLARLRALTRSARALLVVSGRVDLALAAGADGVHLPERGLGAAAVKEAWPDLLVGRSCHDRAGLVAAEAQGADYALLSPVAAPLSKPLEGRALGVDGWRECVRGLHLPVYALGGVTPSLAPALRSAGAAGLASLGGALGAADPGAAVRELLLAWDAGAS